MSHWSEIMKKIQQLQKFKKKCLLIYILVIYSIYVKDLDQKKNIQRVVLNQVYSFTPLLLNITWCQKKSRYRRFKPPKLLNLDENLLENQKLWKQDFMLFMTATEYDEKPDNVISSSKTSSKTYWSILKTFCNGRKIPVIPPILKEGKLESDFKIKANYFSTFFCFSLYSFSE